MRALSEHPQTRFPAPADTTAPAPAESRGLARDDVRLLVGRDQGLVDTRFTHLDDHLVAGDVLVVNDSATTAGEVDAVGDAGVAVVLHLAMPLDEASWVIEVRTAPEAGRAVLDLAPGDGFSAGPVRFELLSAYPADGSSPSGRGNRLWRAEVTGPLSAHLATAGRPIAYGYLDRRYPLSAYQTVFGWRPGSAEMPSAGRPFTTDLVTRLVRKGVVLAPITLHTGVSSQEAGEAPQAERFAVPSVSARLVNTARAAGGRIVAVGTTATRAIESAVDHGEVVARSGWTERVVTPADPPRVVDGLITGWHDPEASHLLLVEAVAGPDLTQRAYDAAIAHEYLWHEFGDSAMLLPGR